MKIVHVMKSGKTRESLDGELPYNKDTEQFYRILAQIAGVKLKETPKEEHHDTNLISTHR